MISKKASLLLRPFPAYVGGELFGAERQGGKAIVHQSGHGILPLFDPEESGKTEPDPVPEAFAQGEGKGVVEGGGGGPVVKGRIGGGIPLWITSIQCGEGGGGEVAAVGGVGKGMFEGGDGDKAECIAKGLSTAEVIAVCEEELFVPDGVKDIEETDGEGFGVYRPSSIGKLGRVGDVAVVGQATVFGGHEVVVAQIGLSFVSLGAESGEEAVRDGFVAIGAVVPPAVDVVDFAAQVERFAEIACEQAFEAFLLLLVTAVEGIGEVCIRYFGIQVNVVLWGGDIGVERVGEDEIARLLPFLKEPAVHGGADISEVGYGKSLSFDEGGAWEVKICRIGRKREGGLRRQRKNYLQ
jgi:hypothetical protein